MSVSLRSAGIVVAALAVTAADVASATEHTLRRIR